MHRITLRCTETADFSLSSRYNYTVNLVICNKINIAAHCLHDTLLQVAALHLVLERLPEFHHLDRVVLEQALVLGAGDSARNRMGVAVGAEGHEDDHTDRGPHQPVGLARIAGVHVDRHVHTRPAGMGDLRTHLDQLADLDRAHELNPAHVRRHAVGAAPPGRAGVAGLVDPLHDRAAVNLSAEVDVGRLGQELTRPEWG